MNSVLQDARYGLRALAKSPGFATVAVLTLALGIGANTAIFTVFDAVMLRMLPVHEPEKLLLVAQMTRDGFDNLTYPVFRELRDRQQVLSGIFASSGQEKIYRVALSGAAGSEPIGPLNLSIVSGEYFQVLGVQAVAGRVFTPDDDRVPGGHPVVVISHGFWERQFGGSPDALGRQLQLRDTLFTIIGVTPRGFFGEAVGSSPDLWVSTMMQPRLATVDALESNASIWLKAFGRLKPGVALERAQAELTTLLQQIRAEPNAPIRPGLTKPTDWFIELQPGGQGWYGWRRVFSKTLWVLMGMVSLVLLLACCNIANLLLARATGRRREIAIRLAMGCGRGRLVRQLLTESVLLALLGGTVALYLAWFGSDVLLQLLSNPSEPFLLDLQLDARVLAYTFGVSVLTGMLFGLLPALQARGLSLDAALRPAREAGQGFRQQRATRALVSGQVALSMFLLILSGLLVRSLQNLRAVDPGFERHNVLLVDVQEGLLTKVSPEIYRPLEERLRQIPGVRSASLSLFGLMQDGGWSASVSAAPVGATPPTVVKTRANAVSPSYFATTGMHLLSGRGIEWSDAERQPAAVAVVNEKLARNLFDGQNPLGKLISLSDTFDPGQAVEVVGVVGDAKYNNLREQDHSIVFFPLARTFLSVELRTEADPLALAQPVRDVLREQDILVREIKTLEEQTDRTLAQERMLADLGGFFGVVALALAAIGLYGALATAVSRRTNEIGLRLALGARRSDVLGLWLREAGILVAIGIALGLPAALAATRWIESFLFGLTPYDPWAIAGAVGVLAAVAALAAYLPARRAARLDPMEALRYE